MQYYVNDCPSSPQSSRLPLPLAYTHWILPSNQHSPAASNIQTRISAATTAKTDLICLYMFKKRVCSMTSSPCRISGPSAPQGAQESSVDLPPRRCARRSAHTSCPRQRCCTSARDIPPSYTDHASLMTGVMLGIYWVRSC